MTAFPSSVDTLLLFLEFLAREYRSPKAVRNVLASLRFHHERLGFSLEQFGHFKFRLALRSLPFTMRSHVSQAPPFPWRLLGPLVQSTGLLGPWALVFKALVTLAFVTFARLSSLVPPTGRAFESSRWPTLADLVFNGDGASLRLKYSKTRQGADGGRWIPFRASHTSPCPLAIARRLLQGSLQAGAPLSAPLFALRSTTGSTVTVLTQAQARRFLATTLGALGLPTRAFTFHSFRRGGCSHAFAQGAAESDLALHGDWRSAAVREYYPAGLARQRVAISLASPI